MATLGVLYIIRVKHWREDNKECLPAFRNTYQTLSVDPRQEGDSYRVGRNFKNWGHGGDRIWKFLTDFVSSVPRGSCYVQMST